MMLSILSILLLPLLASAQYGPANPSPTGTGSGSSSSTSSAPASAPSAPPSNSTAINVDVGAGGKFVYNPANITAANGTVVTFFFPSGSIPHSVTQSSFAEPCTYLAAANGSSGGFDSGLQNSVQFSINIVNDQEPIWFHCKTPTHCGLGMVGSINAPSSGNNTYAAFQSAALAIGSSEPTEANNGPVTGGVGAIATANPAATFAASSSGSSSSSSAGRTAASGGFALVAVAVSMMLA